MKVRIFLVLLGGLLCSGVAIAQEDISQKPPLDLLFRTLELKFYTEDLKGTVTGLAVKETATEIIIKLPGDILFDFDKWGIRPEAEPTLLRVAEVINQYPKGNVLIEGHTDAKGADSYNLPLSQKRANAVKDWLVKKGGVDGRQLAAKGWGKSKPVAPNTKPDGSDNPEGRQKNRRVEVTVKKQ
jgi:outer membrane protein OmpA-like peptidoglycan-associated protein